jgi:hypothetical protein
MGFIEPTLKKKQQYWKVKQGESKKAQLFFSVIQIYQIKTTKQNEPRPMLPQASSD